MGQVSDWWLNRTIDGDWHLPISSFQGFRPVGGYLIGTASALEFVPNRFEAMAGAATWMLALDEIEHVELGRRRLRITSPAGRQTLFTNRPQAVRRHLGALLDRRPASTVGL